VLSQVIIDRVLPRQDDSLLWVIAAVMVGLMALAVAITLTQRWILARTAAFLDADTVEFISDRILRLPMRYFESRRTGDIQRRLAGLQQVRSVLIQSGIAGLTAGTQFVVAIVIMFIYSWQLTLVFLACAPLYVVLMRYSAARIRPVLDSVEEGSGRYQSRQIDAIKGIETVKSMGAEGGLLRRMTHDFSLVRDKQYHADLATMAYEGLVSSVNYLIYGLFLVLGAYEVLQHQLTLGQFVAFSSLVVLANSPLVTFLGLYDRVQLVTVLMGRLNDVFEQEPEQGHW
jgi:ATP-binding cassette subfamily B protein